MKKGLKSPDTVPLSLFWHSEQFRIKVSRLKMHTNYSSKIIIDTDSEHEKVQIEKVMGNNINTYFLKFRFLSFHLS